MHVSANTNTNTCLILVLKSITRSSEKPDMEFLDNLKSLINDLASSALPAINTSAITTGGIERRSNIINDLGVIKASLDEVNRLLSDKIAFVKQIQTKEIEELDFAITKLKKKDSKSSNDQWSVVGGHKGRAVVPIPKQQIVTPIHAAIKITESMTIPAITVQSFAQVRQDGELYYVDSADHFAFKLAGKLFHGNIGIIYTDEKNPVKIKNCKFDNTCVKKDTCDYFHDPLKFSDSKDKRNFIASSWLYASPTSQFKNKLRSRRFGSREFLDTDLIDLQDEEVSRFYDQATHDILCSLLLNLYISLRRVE